MEKKNEERPNLLTSIIGLMAVFGPIVFFCFLPDPPPLPAESIPWGVLSWVTKDLASQPSIFIVWIIAMAIGCLGLHIEEKRKKQNTST